MSNRHKYFDERQFSILELIKGMQAQRATEGAASCVSDLKAALRIAIKNSSMSRHQIAGEMSHLAGVTITKEQIDSWTRESDDGGRHIPAEYLPAFCKTTQSTEPLAVLCRTAGAFVLPGPEALRSEIQRLDEEEKRVRQQKKQRLMFLGEITKER